MRRAIFPVLLVAAAGSVASCSSGGTQIDLGPSTFHVEITSVNGNMPPTADMPLPANKGDKTEEWAFHIEARTPTGEPTPFNGYVRLSTKPGTVTEVTGTGATGRNILLKDGVADGVAKVTAVYGPTRLWVEDLGYTPAAPNTQPKCSNGKDDDGDGLIDYPSDPGCAFADDDSEEGGTFAAGVSAPVQYARPKISDVRGDGAVTPYPAEAIEINTGDPQKLIVTRVSSDGFYITDVNATEMMNGYNSVFAFNFSTPAGMRVCDRLVYLSGTSNDFFGFTELNFPSYKTSFAVLGSDGTVMGQDGGVADCEVPEPAILDDSVFGSDKNATARALRKVESGLVRIVGFKVAANFGSGLAVNNLFKPGQSSCDFNGDGQIDFTQIAPNCPAGRCEGECASLCDADPDCSEWTAFSARAEFKVSKGTAMIKINTSTVAGFDPVGNSGKTLDFVTGTLREFSGGTLNWTIETRCPDDLVCPAEQGCQTQQPLSSKTACVRLRTVDDNDQGTN
jgi:hypothetical protein